MTSPDEPKHPHKWDDDDDEIIETEAEIVDEGKGQSHHVYRTYVFEDEFGNQRVVVLPSSGCGGCNCCLGCLAAVLLGVLILSFLF